jgi:hypothetical protein
MATALEQLSNHPLFQDEYQIAMKARKVVKSVSRFKHYNSAMAYLELAEKRLNGSMYLPSILLSRDVLHKWAENMEQDFQKAESLGRQAAKDGKTQDDNPYCREVSNPYNPVLEIVWNHAFCNEAYGTVVFD